MSSINWGSVADWVSGLGSFAAVATALYLARISDRVKLKVTAGLRMVIGGGLLEPQEIVSFSATNIGTRATVITNIGIRIGRAKKHQKFALINIVPDEWSQGIPLTLKDGERGHWGIPLDKSRTWLREMISKDMIESVWDVGTLVFIFGTSNGGEFIAPAEEPMKKAIREMLEPQ